MSEKTISVLIPTLGRQKELIDTVNSLLKQTRVPDEIVVVDQNGSAFPELDRFLDSIPIVRHIKATTPGVSVNYNRCLQAAKSDIVLYVDDDVVPKPDLVERHLENYQNATIVGIAGRVLEPGQTSAQNVKPGTFHPWTGSITTAFNGTVRTSAQFAQGANMSFRREALLSIGGFDAGFTGNGYFFETDACLRLIELGHKIVFDPKAELDHLMAPSGGARVKDKSRHTMFFVRNGIRLERRHAPTLALLIFVVRMCAYVIAKAVYNGDIRVLHRGLMGVAQGISQSMEKT